MSLPEIFPQTTTFKFSAHCYCSLSAYSNKNKAWKLDGLIEVNTRSFLKMIKMLLWLVIPIYLSLILNLIFLLSHCIRQAQATTTSPVVSNNAKDSSRYECRDVA